MSDDLLAIGAGVMLSVIVGAYIKHIQLTRGKLAGLKASLTFDYVIAAMVISSLILTVALDREAWRALILSALLAFIGYSIRTTRRDIVKAGGKP